MYRSFCPKEVFFNICVLSECIVYWIHFQNIHTFTYWKTKNHTLFVACFWDCRKPSVYPKGKGTFPHHHVILLFTSIYYQKFNSNFEDVTACKITIRGLHRCCLRPVSLLNKDFMVDVSCEFYQIFWQSC